MRKVLDPFTRNVSSLSSLMDVSGLSDIVSPRTRKMDGVSDEDSEEESDDGQSACVFDIGSGLSKVGFGGDEEPLSVFPTIVGKPRTQSTQQSFYYGEAVKLNRNHLYVRYPVEHGVITNWYDMVWYVMYSEF